MRIKRFICALLLVCLAVATVPALQNAALAAPAYYVTVDRTNQIVTVYENGNVTEDGIVRQMICSTGASKTPTPKGTFTLPKKSRASERTEWYYFAASRCYAKWATRIKGGILFHSILYNSKKGNPTSASVNALGSPASHGCVRLRVDDAKWIAKNVAAGTKVKIFDGKKNSALRKKVLAKTFSRDKQTYDDFMGRAPKDPNLLAKGSTGDNVRKLQSQLKALGFYTGSIDGKFGSTTVTAVKNFEAACSLSQTGQVRLNESLWNRIFASDAPTGTYVTLTQGMTGAAVKALQQALKDLKMYAGAVDGSYSAATTEAVKRYQQGFGFTVDGKAATNVQNDALSRAASVKKQFGSAEYRLVERANPIQMAKVKAKTLYMRKKKSNGSKKVKKLKKNKKVRVLSRGKKWSRVQYGKKTGYVRSKYLKFYTATETVLDYEAVPAATPAPTPYIPAQTPAVAAPPAAMPEPDAEPTPEPVIAPIDEPTSAPTAEPTPAPAADVALTDALPEPVAAEAELEMGTEPDAEYPEITDGEQPENGLEIEYETWLEIAPEAEEPVE